jgi:hypothetical protein
MRCHVSCGSGPRLPIEGSGAATCPMAPYPASLLRRAPTLPLARGSRSSLPVEEGSDATTCPVTPASASLLRRAPALPRVPWVSAGRESQE